jgi:purine-binding chemotaxis protein CheW
LNETSKTIITEDRYSILQISEQNFGVEVINVKEVLPLPKITPLPNVHESVLGIFSLRGQIYSLLDLRLFFRLGRPPLNERNFVVIIEIDDISFGLVVDKVLDVIYIDSSKIIIPTRDMSSQYIQYLCGYFEHKKLGVIYILDFGAIIDAKEIRQYRYKE